MKKHQVRVMNERSRLNSKRKKLDTFILLPVFDSLPQEDKGLLVTQSLVMSRYSDILTQRIERF